MLTGMIVALVLAVLGAALDVYTTKRAVADRPQVFTEGNPIMRALFHLGGIWALAAAKLVMLGFVFWVVLSWQSWPTNLAGMFCGLLWLFMGYRNRKLLLKAAGILLVLGGISAAASAGEVKTPSLTPPPLYPKGRALGAMTMLMGPTPGMAAGAGWQSPTGVILLGQVTYQTVKEQSGTVQARPIWFLPPTTIPFETDAKTSWGFAITVAFPFK